MYLTRQKIFVNPVNTVLLPLTPSSTYKFWLFTFIFSLEKLAEAWQIFSIYHIVFPQFFLRFNSAPLRSCCNCNAIKLQRSIDRLIDGRSNKSNFHCEQAATTVITKWNEICKNALFNGRKGNFEITC